MKRQGVYALAYLALFLAGPASAITLATNPVPLAGAGSSGTIDATIELVSTQTGAPAGAVVVYGSIAPTATTLLFRASVGLASDPVAVFGLAFDDDGNGAAGLLPFLAAGYVPGPGTNVQVGNIAGGNTEIGIARTTAPIDSFAPGSVTDLFFVSYAASPVPGKFVIAGASDDFFVFPLPVIAAVEIVPEPGTAALLAVGLAALARRRH